MIAGATRGRGGGALARHFLQQGDGAQRVRVVDVRELAASATLAAGRPEVAVREGFRELGELSAHGLTDRWCQHVHVDPPPDDPAPRETAARFLSLYEAEFQLAGPRIVVEHEKGGRVHWHVAYSLIGEDGRMVDGLGHHHRRVEKLARITECERGLPLTKGAHNRSVIAALRREGREDVALELEQAGLHRGDRARAAETPRERAQRERFGGPSPREVGDACLEAWRESGGETGAAAELEAALRKRGLELRAGNRGAVVVDRAGSVHFLSRRLGEASKRVEGARIRAGTVRVRLVGARLAGVETGRQRCAEARTRPDWSREVEAAVWETKALGGGLASLRHCLGGKGISMRWDTARRGWNLSRGESGSYGIQLAAGGSLQAGDLREMRRIDEARRDLVRHSVGRMEAGAAPGVAMAELRRAGLEIEWRGSRFGWQVVGDDGARYGRADTICGREPGALDPVLERMRERPSRGKAEGAGGRLAQAAFEEGTAVVAESVRCLVETGPPNDAVRDAEAAYHLAVQSENLDRIHRAAERLSRAQLAYADARRRWEERERRLADARRRARERRARERSVRTRM